MEQSFFPAGATVYVYTRSQAIEDGVLVDVTENFPDLVRDAGFTVHVAMTDTVFKGYVELTPVAEKTGNDIKGRMWDILWMLRMAAQRSNGESNVLFQLYVVRDRVKPTLCTLKSVIGPGDDGEPVITIMEPGED